MAISYASMWQLLSPNILFDNLTFSLKNKKTL